MIFVTRPGTLQVGGLEIPFRSVAKGNYRQSVRISFSDEGELLVETPDGGIHQEAWEFIRAKEKWILYHYRRLGTDLEKRRQFHARMEHSIPLLGVETPITWQAGPKTRFRFEKFSRLLVQAPENYLQTHKKQLLAAAGRSLAKGYLELRLNRWSGITGLPYKRLSVKDHVSKWGSCSSDRNINLNWNLVWLEEALVDYVIVHELMHIREMNHGPRFWNWVGKYLPDYRRLDKLVDERQWVIGILK